MRRLTWIAVAALALLGAGIAVAHEGHTNSIQPVSATFTAATASNVRTSTCTITGGTNAGTYTTTRGRWSGSVAGDTTNTLNSTTATIDAQIVVGPTGDGTVEGKLRTNHTVAGFDAVIDKSGNFAGLAEGRGGGDENESFNNLVGNISGNWTSAGGFTGGKIGGGTSGGNAVLLGRGGCQNTTQKPETVEAKGALTIGSGTVTVAGVTCTVPANSSLAADVTKIGANARVEIKCTTSAGVNTLVRISGRHGDD